MLHDFRPQSLEAQKPPSSNERSAQVSASGSVGVKPSLDDLNPGLALPHMGHSPNNDQGSSTETRKRSMTGGRGGGRRSHRPEAEGFVLFHGGPAAQASQDAPHEVPPHPPVGRARVPVNGMIRLSSAKP